MFKTGIRTSVFLTWLTFLAFSSAFAQTSGYKYEPPAPAKDGIRVGTLSRAGVADSVIEDATNKLLAGSYGNIHSFLIARDGLLVHERYFKGEDFQRGKGRLGVVEHGA